MRPRISSRTHNMFWNVYMHGRRGVFLLGFVVISLSAHAQYAEPVFGVHQSEREFLHYNRYSNCFDSLCISLMIGEFYTQHENTKSLLHLDKLASDLVIQGDNVQGRDNLLADYGIVSDFVVPSSGCTLHWWRLFECNEPRVHNGKSSMATLGMRDASGWQVGKGTVLDQTEFRVELCNAHNAVVAVVDSFGVNRNPGSELAEVFGTSPDRSNRSFEVASAFAGQHLHCRIVPYRIGSTPYGMSLQQYDREWDVSLSSIQQIVGANYYFASEKRWNALHEAYKKEFFQYCDSIIASTGMMPVDVPRCMIADVGEEYTKRYNIVDTTSNGTVISHPKYPYNSSQHSSVLTPADASAYPPQIAFAPVKGHPRSSGDSAEIVILNAAQDDSPATLDLLCGPSGERPTIHNDLRLQHGANRVVVNLKDAKDGRYLMLLKDTKRFVTCTKVLEVSRQH